MLRKKDDDLLKDKRIAEMHRRLGKAKPKEYEKDIKSLPDNEGNYEYVDLEEVDETLEAGAETANKK